MVRAHFPPPGTHTLRTILNCIIVLLSCSVWESANESSKDFFFQETDLELYSYYILRE